MRFRIDRCPACGSPFHAENMWPDFPYVTEFIGQMSWLFGATFTVIFFVLWFSR